MYIILKIDYIELFDKYLYLNVLKPLNPLSTQYKESVVIWNLKNNLQSCLSALLHTNKKNLSSQLWQHIT